MPQLVALDLPAGQAFVDALLNTWDAGDAVLPLDQRLPRPDVRLLVDTLRPSTVVDADGVHSRGGGVPTAPGDALVVTTSGSTGAPKGVVLTHEAVRSSAMASSTALAVDAGMDRWVACLPFSHIGGLSVLTRALVTGTPCTVLERFDAAEVERLARGGATLVSLVTTALRRCDASGYRRVLLGGSSPPEGLPDNVVTTYGMTETGSGVVYDGRPLDGVEVRIGDGRTGGEGEVLVRGPMLLRCYRDGTDPHLAEGWLPTGDGGRVEPDGTVAIFGRMAEVVVSGGEKVWPAPVEAVLTRHAGIREVAVWKRPDPEWGERVVAWVVPADRDLPPDLGALRELVAAELAPWAAPRELVLTDALPRTPNGKIQRTSLV